MNGLTQVRLQGQGTVFEEISLNIRNLFDKDPPFYNSANGYDANVANPLGRVITIGLTAKL